MNKHENVPQMIIKNAAGLFMAEIGAPFKIMPTKTEITPIVKPTTVDVSKISPPLFPDHPPNADRHTFLDNPCPYAAEYNTISYF